MKKKKRRRSVRGLSRNIDVKMALITADIEMLDLVLAEDHHDRPERSEHQDAWVEGCREGMAIAYDKLSGSLQDVAIRSMFRPFPVKLRYYPGARRTVKDDSLISG